MPIMTLRLAAGLAAALLGISLLVATPAVADSTDGDYSYVDNGNGTATLTKYGGTSLDVVVPGSVGGLTVTGIGDYAFQGSRWGYSLASVSIPDTVTSIGQFAFESNGLTSLTIPDSVTTIGVAAFGLNPLTQLTLSKSLTTLPYAAFYYTDLTSVTIPSSVTSIADYVFVGAQLSSVVFLGDAPSVVSDAGTGNSSFIGSDALKIHYNPATSGWSNPWHRYTTVGDVVEAHALTITGTVSDYEPWLDPTSQPIVRLTIVVRDEMGAPAVGAKVTLSNANSTAPPWTVPANGTISVVRDVSKGVPDVTVTAVRDGITASKVLHVFNTEVMTQCHLPGEPRQSNALSSVLDSVLASSPNQLLDRVSRYLDVFSKGVSVLPEKYTTVGTATKYTGSFKTIYGLDSRVIANADGSVVKQYPQAYSRSYDVVKPLFNGDGTIIQIFGRNLLCGVPA